MLGDLIFHILMHDQFLVFAMLTWYVGIYPCLESVTLFLKGLLGAVLIIRDERGVVAWWAKFILLALARFCSMLHVFRVITLLYLHFIAIWWFVDFILVVLLHFTRCYLSSCDSGSKHKKEFEIECGSRSCLISQIHTSWGLWFDSFVVFINDFVMCQKKSLLGLTKSWRIRCPKIIKSSCNWKCVDGW